MEEGRSLESEAVTIWERRIQIEREEKTERQNAVDPITEKYRPKYEALQMECETEGHEWSFVTFGVGGQSFFACKKCRKSRVEP